ncbi:MAG TPA: TonB-dependent receptor [Opitutaceae bacterium]|nr:TonB-dependent receptor [Opitutaceae bacterium]
MKFWRDLRTGLVLLLTTSVICAPAHALVTFNDGHDHIYVTGTIGVAYDSNIFANNFSEDDVVYTATLLGEYARRAGWITVNGSVELTASRFSSHEDENFENPKFELEFTKQGGRTTGSLTLSAAKENRVDPFVNIRNESWNYGAGLNVKYPVIDRYSLAGSVFYSLVDYSDNRLYVDLRSYGASADLFYVLSKERDLTAGYRFRKNQGLLNTSTTDHAFTAGLKGRIVRGYNGSVRFGYQTRILDDTGDTSFDSWTGSGSVTHAFGKRFSLTGDLAKDFSTTSTNVSIDTLRTSLDGQYTFNARWNAHGGIGYSRTRFLGAAGIILPGGRQREDSTFFANVGVGYNPNEHLKVSLNYTWAENWSTLQYSDFIRRGWSLTVSSRW